MATNRFTLVLQHLRRSALLLDGAEPTDARLLEAFLQGRDGLALEALVRRHAPMVWGVCCVAVSPDGRYAHSGSSDQTVRRWRLPAPAPAPQPGG